MLDTLMRGCKNLIQVMNGVLKKIPYNPPLVLAHTFLNAFLLNCFTMLNHLHERVFFETPAWLYFLATTPFFAAGMLALDWASHMAGKSKEGDTDTYWEHLTTTNFMFTVCLVLLIIVVSVIALSSGGA
jgi:hypothetical protein